MQEDEEPEARAPHYLTTPNVEAPTGYVAVANFDLPSSERQAVLVPNSVTAQLAADWRQADARLGPPWWMFDMGARHVDTLHSEDALGQESAL